MKKRLRRKLGKGEYANPYPHTRRELAANAQVAACLQVLVDAVGPDKFIRWVETHNEA